MRFGITEYPDQGIKYYNSFEKIFNNGNNKLIIYLQNKQNWLYDIVWANNGDMISRMYAGTSALKGDFTR